MLITDFYTIKDFQLTENHIQAQILLNADHEVYTGHFPEQAVVPGVIQLQMIKELMEKAANRKLLLSEMGFAKFLNAIVPESSSVLSFIIDFQESNDQIKITATIKDDRLVYTKMKARLTWKNQELRQKTKDLRQKT